MVLVALGISAIQRPVYRGDVRVLLQPRSSEALFDVSGAAPQDPARRVDTEIEVVRSEPVRAAVRRRLGPVPKPIVAALGNSDIIRISAQSADRARAGRIAREYAEAYVEFRRQRAVDDIQVAIRNIQGQIDQLQAQIASRNDAIGKLGGDAAASAGIVAVRDRLAEQQAVFNWRRDNLQVEAQLNTGGAQVVTQGVVPTTKVRPVPVAYGAIAAMVGLVLGIALALILESLDDSIKGKDDLDAAVPGVPLLGLISMVEGWDKPDLALLVSRDDPGSPSVESYRALRTAMQFLGGSVSPGIVQVTSANAGEGKTAIVSNLGVVMAQAGKKVILVDCDLRRARLHEFFGLENDVGFTTLFLCEASVDDVATDVPGVENLRVVTSGVLPPNPSEVLSSGRTAEVLAALREACDLVVVDSPPVLPVADASALSVWMEATVLVARAHSTRSHDVRRAVEVLLQVHAPLLGTVLNAVGRHDENYYTSSYYRPSGRPQAARGADARAHRPPRRPKGIGTGGKTAALAVRRTAGRRRRGRRRVAFGTHSEPWLRPLSG